MKKTDCGPITLSDSRCTLPDTRPQFNKAYYRCYINGGFLFKKYHLSGILLLKSLDLGRRLVFANEAGYVFFDFGWYFSPQESNAVYDSFVVHSIIPQLNKKALIKTLRKDLELALSDVNNRERYDKGDTAYYKTAVEAGGFAWFIFSPNYSLRRIEVPGRRSPVTTVYKHQRSLGNERNMFDTLSVIHHRAHFTIQAYRFLPSTNTDTNAE